MEIVFWSIQQFAVTGPPLDDEELLLELEEEELLLELDDEVLDEDELLELLEELEEVLDEELPPVPPHPVVNSVNERSKGMTVKGVIGRIDSPCR